MACETSLKCLPEGAPLAHYIFFSGVSSVPHVSAPSFVDLTCPPHTSIWSCSLSRRPVATTTLLGWIRVAFPTVCANGVSNWQLGLCWLGCEVKGVFVQLFFPPSLQDQQQPC